MYRRILCLGLLGCFSQGAYAACNVGVALTGGDVEFNPFNPATTSLNLAVIHNGTDYPSLSVRFGTPLPSGSSPSSSLSGYPDYKITIGATDHFISSDVGVTNYSPVTTITNFSATSNHTLPVTPAEQTGLADALTPIASGSVVTLPVIIEGADNSGNPLCDNIGTPIEIDMGVSIPEARAVAFSSLEFSNATPTPGALDAGILGNSEVTKQSTLYMWSNTLYKISASSTNGYMLRTTDLNDNPITYSGTINDVNKLPYTLTVNTANPISIGGASAASAVKTATSDGSDGITKVEGKQVVVEFETEDIGKRAGKYSDTVTLTISLFP